MEIRRCDLRSLIERDLKFFIARDIAIKRHLRQRRDESSRRVIGRFNNACVATRMLCRKPIPKISPCLREKRYQLANLGMPDVLT